MRSSAANTESSSGPSNATAISSQSRTAVATSTTSSDQIQSLEDGLDALPRLIERLDRTANHIPSHRSRRKRKAKRTQQPESYPLT
ncbi:hypothetical protein K474DRAFT_138550 [Panus rudis PR-1116 ss-1]|nr:hypothetical protein K474DRAFT_138550 [Panus rudis PR-1116 ss-1]